MVAEAGATGPKIHDARVAALCVAHGVRQLWSVDRDFTRFPVAVHNPLGELYRGLVVSETSFKSFNNLAFSLSGGQISFTSGTQIISTIGSCGFTSLLVELIND